MREIIRGNLTPAISPFCSADSAKRGEGTRSQRFAELRHAAPREGKQGQSQGAPLYVSPSDFVAKLPAHFFGQNPFADFWICCGQLPFGKPGFCAKMSSDL